MIALFSPTRTYDLSNTILNHWVELWKQEAPQKEFWADLVQTGNTETPKSAHDIRGHSHCRWQVTFNASYSARLLDTQRRTPFKMRKTSYVVTFFLVAAILALVSKDFVVLHCSRNHVHIARRTSFLLGGRIGTHTYLLSGYFNLHSIYVGLWSNRLKFSTPR